MAKLRVESDLPITPEAAWALFESPEYRQRLNERAQISQEVLDEAPRAGGRILRRLRTEPERELPGMVSSLLGASKLSYVQENELDPAARRIDWTVKLEVLTDKVDVSGSTVLEPTPTGCRRVVDGDIRVRVMLVGGQIEKAVVAEFEKSMRRAVEVARELIEEQGLA